MLAVDLDGTLLRTDLLWECFCSALGRDWRILWQAPLALLTRGRAGLKRMLAGRAMPEVATLPFNPAVLEAVRRWRENGGRTVLVTASDVQLAEAIAAHLGLFDEVHGSDGTHNLKGEAKADFLEARFGRGGFLYAGDAAADLPVWSRAAGAWVVSPSGGLRRRAEALSPRVEVLPSGRGDWRDWLRALRPHQWLKNLLVFLPLLAAHRFDPAGWGLALLAFLAFSSTASGVYLFNDLLDLSADRAHPRKRQRPFAAGRLPLAGGIAAGVGLLLLGFAIGLAAGKAFLMALLAYLVLTSAYSLRLKRHAVIDICTLAALYTLRIIAGALACDLTLTVWLLSFSVFFFLSLATVKRQAELVDLQSRGQLEAQGRGYHVEDLPIIAPIALASGYVSVLVLALYLNSPNVLVLYRTPQILWGICFVLLYWITRTVMLAHRGLMHDDPLVYAVKDRVSLACFGLIVVLAAAGTVV